MNVVIVLVIAAVLLFLLAFISRRRFGVLGVALAAGYVLQRLWEPSFPGWAAQLQLPLDLLVSPLTIIGLVVLLLPSLLLLLGGPTYKKGLGRSLGSALYALLAVLFGLAALAGSMDLSGESRQLYELVMQYRDYILTAALALAVVDVMHASSSGPKPDKKKHGH